MRENTDQNHSECGQFSCSSSFRSFLYKIIFSLCLRQIFAIHHPEILNLLKKRKNMVIKCIHLIICQINLKQLVTSEEAGCFGRIVYLNLHMLGVLNCPPPHKIWQNTGFPKPLFSHIRTKPKILYLYGRICVKENPLFGIYYTVYITEFVTKEIE